MIYSSFSRLITDTHRQFRARADLIQPARWQGVATAGRPDLETYEILNHSSTVDLPTEDLGYYQLDIKPDLPWADDHFDERVCGYPLNPGVQWAKWRMGRGADSFRDSSGRFNHNYMERFWPKIAGKVPAAEYPPEFWEDQPAIQGIRHPYGDLGDLVHQLVREPDTRQAVLPMFFPEDTGAVHSGRVPCSLTWQFIVRQNMLHMTYSLRSVDLVNHWRNDLYMAVRLLLWVLDRCRRLSPNYWTKIHPGCLTTHITSFHCFRGNWHQVEGSDR